MDFADKKAHLKFNKRSKNGHRQSGPNFGIPHANIIDLKKIHNEKKEKEKQIIKDNENIITKISNIKWPKLSIPKKIHHKTALEKILVSKINQDAPTEISINKKKENQKTAKQIPTKPDINQIKLDVKQFSLSSGWYKRLAVFSLVSLAIIAPIYLMNFYENAKQTQGQVLGISSEAYDFLKEAGSFATSSEFSEAGESFGKAAESFIEAQDQLESAGGVVLSIANIVPNKAKSAEYLLSAGAHMSKAGVLVSEIIPELENFDVNPLDNKQVTTLTDFLFFIKTELQPVQTELELAISDIDNVRTKDLPDEYQESMALVKNSLPALENGFDRIFSVADVLLVILGHEAPQRYLLTFQNNRELRPTGGFIGSIALMDIYKGNIENLEVPGGGVYDIAGQLNEKIISPKPLWLVNPHWNIQDSNWFADFPTSAEKIIWFYERAGRTTVDGVMSMTPEVILDLLKITGPIVMDDYGLTIDHSNFIRETQYQAEIAYDKEENQPKKIIGDMLPKLFDKIFLVESTDFLKIVDVFNKSLGNKDILFYFTDENLENKINELSWGGKIIDTNKDYLMVVSSNIAGGKTDHVVDQLVSHEVNIQSDGSMINTVKISRTHQGNSLDIWEGEDNVSYLRIYVPKGSELVSIEGYDNIPSFRYLLPDQDATTDDFLSNIERNSIIDESTGTRITTEFNKTVFGNWISISPGETQELIISYKLPFNLDFGGLFDKTDSYRLYVQKQPGLINNFFTTKVNWSDDISLIWNQAGFTIDEHSAEYVTDLDSDKILGVIIKK